MGKKTENLFATSSTKRVDKKRKFVRFIDKTNKEKSENKMGKE
jgi:hypothetical protein